MFYMYMWQPRVEIEHYSVAYFHCITVFEALLGRSSYAVGKLMIPYHIYTAHMSPTLNQSSAF